MNVKVDFAALNSILSVMEVCEKDIRDLYPSKFADGIYKDVKKLRKQWHENTFGE